ncbi:MAG: NAD kinase [Alphaproteobacteria bacterium]|nr:NAD kinase [Alphaproteobacteria bacterium]
MYQKFHFLSNSSPEAQSAYKSLLSTFMQTEIENADAIVAIGGDGTLLNALRKSEGRNIPVYGINRGSVGFLMNAPHLENLKEKIDQAESVQIHPLLMKATDIDGRTFEAVAFNEVSLLRQVRQAAKITISIDNVIRMDELICDGVMVATPAGSTAYNLSAHGPILPLKSEILALTPISAFRPRRWRGALLPSSAVIRFDILDSQDRPVSATADEVEIRDVRSVEISQSTITKTLLFDKGHSLEERILKEQFAW